MKTDVAVIGGGPVGLAAALLLARLGIRVTLIERNSTTSTHPRGHVLSARTMEILRAIGLEDTVRLAGLPAERNMGIAFATRLAKGDIAVLETRGIPEREAAYAAASPSAKLSCPQDVFEPLLFKAVAASANAKLLFETKLLEIHSREDGVDLSCIGPDGRFTIEAKYVVAADGARSLVRERLGIDMSGPGRIGRQIGVYFEADLWEHIQKRPYLLWWLFNRETCGVLISLDGRRRWTYNFAFDPEKEAVEQFTPARCEKIVRAAIGDEHVPLTIKSVLPWRMQARLATSFQAGRVFIAGDAAHPLPPTGGQGMNTGIGDVHNLAWKLALVLHGIAPDELLRSYDLERRPIAKINVDQSVHNAMKMAESGLSGMATHDSPIAHQLEGPEAGEAEAHIRRVVPSLREHFDYLGQTFGYRYESDWIVSDGSTAPLFQIEAYEPSAAPGHRAPHVWLRHGKEKVSTIDLIGFGRFSLLTTPKGGSWIDAFEALIAELSVPGQASEIGAGAAYQDDGEFSRIYQLDEGGMVLVRPDGHVAARSAGMMDRPDDFLRRSLRQVLKVTGREGRRPDALPRVASRRVLKA